MQKTIKFYKIAVFFAISVLFAAASFMLAAKSDTYAADYSLTVTAGDNGSVEVYSTVLVGTEYKKDAHIASIPHLGTRVLTLTGGLNVFFILEAMPDSGYQVDWDGSTNTVTNDRRNNNEWAIIFGGSRTINIVFKANEGERVTLKNFLKRNDGSIQVIEDISNYNMEGGVNYSAGDTMRALTRGELGGYSPCEYYEGDGSNGWYFYVNGYFVEANAYHTENDNVLFNGESYDAIKSAYRNFFGETIIATLYREMAGIMIDILNNEFGLNSYTLTNVDEYVPIPLNDSDYYEVTKETRVRVTAIASDYYTFDKFSSSSTMEIGTDVEGNAYAEVDVLRIEKVSISFTAKQYNLSINIDTSGARGEFAHRSNNMKVKLGDTLNINFNSNVGYSLSSFEITGVTLSEQDIKLGSASIYIDDTFLNTFLNGNLVEIEGALSTKIDTMLMIIIVSVGVVIPLLVIGVIIMLLLSRSKKLQAAANAERSAKVSAGFNTSNMLRDLTRDDKHDGSGQQ